MMQMLISVSFTRDTKVAKTVAQDTGTTGEITSATDVALAASSLSVPSMLLKKLLKSNQRTKS